MGKPERAVRCHIFVAAADEGVRLIQKIKNLQIMCPKKGRAEDSMIDQGPTGGDPAEVVEMDEKPKRKTAKASKSVVVSHDQLSFFTRFEEVAPNETVERTRIDPLPTGAVERTLIDPVPAISAYQVGTGEGDKEPASNKPINLMDRFPGLQPFQNNRPGTARAGLVKLLNECLIDGQIPRGNDPTKINRLHFAEALGMTSGSITREVDLLAAYEAILEEVEPAATIYTRFGAKITKQADGLLSADTRTVLAKYPKLHKHQFYPLEGNAGRLVGLLNGQILSENIERSRGGRLNRAWLAERLGITKTAITPYNEIIGEYEEAIGGVESVIEAKIPDMRRWLDECMANGTLEIRDQKIARMPFYEQFGMAKNSLVLLRYPRIAALIEEYDELVRRTGYQPKDTADKLERLVALLADDPDLNKDGKSIHRGSLEAALGLSATTISRPPYLQLMLEADELHRQALENDPYISVQCGRVFKFGKLVEQGWPAHFVIRIKESFAKNYRTLRKDDAKSLYLAFRDILSHIAESGSAACSAVRNSIAAAEAMKPLERHWTMVTQEYRDHVGGRYENKGSANAKLRTTNRLLRDFGNDAVLPPHSLNLVGFREDNPTHLRSAAEVTPESGKRATSSHVDEYLNFATSMLNKAAISYEVEVSATDQSDFNKVLRAELEGQEIKVIESPSAVILRVLNRRLQLLEDAAVAIVDAARKDWEHGQSLIARGVNPSDDEWSNIINLGEINRFDRDQLLRKHFPQKGEDKERGLANLLAVVVNRYGSQYPGTVTGSPEGQFFAKRALEFGRLRKLQSYLTPSQPAVSAITTLYLLASGSNVSVGRELYFDCIETSEEPRHSKVTGFKSRAGGKPIFVTLEDRCPAISGMRWLQEACAIGRTMAGDDTRQLFIAKATLDSGFKMTEEWAYRSDFKAMVASVPELADLPLTPNMLRPSILLRAVLQEDGRNKLSLALGQHGEAVNGGYTNKFPTRLIRDADARHFMHSFETVVIQRVEEALSFLEISPEGFERRVEAVMQTGLGTMCADRNGRPGNDGKSCTSIDCWNDCPQLLVIARARDIAILQIWQYSLRVVEGDWVRDQPERWEKVWLPWLAFVDAVEIKMRQPAFLAVWRDATELANQFRAQPNFQPMRLF